MTHSSMASLTSMQAATIKGLHLNTGNTTHECSLTFPLVIITSWGRTGRLLSLPSLSSLAVELVDKRLAHR
jgi:hypothetical protein